MPILQQGLSHADVRTQWRAAELLGDMGAKAAPAREALVKLLQEEPKRRKGMNDVFSPNDVRAQAAFALGCMGVEPDQTVSLLTAMLKHEDPTIRIGSAQGLGQMGDRAQAAIPALVECLADEKMILSPAVGPAYPGHSAAAALVAIGPSSLSAIIGALGAEQATIRRHAADALESFAPEEVQPAVETLFQRLHDPDAGVRRAAAHLLGWIAPHAESLVPELVRLTRDEDPDVRIQAATTLGYLEPKEVIALGLLDSTPRRP